MIHREKHESYWSPVAKGLTAFATLLICQGLWAQDPGVDPGANYELSYVANAAHGDLIAEGRYRRVVHLLSGGRHNSFARMTNLCVARTLLGDFRMARRDCNRSVELGEQAAVAATEGDRQSRYDYWGSALSNRGVLRAIRQQLGAEEDFLQAIVVQTHSATATQNLARLKQVEHRELAAQ